MNGESYMDFKRNYVTPSKFEYGFYVTICVCTIF